MTLTEMKRTWQTLLVFAAMIVACVLWRRHDPAAIVVLSLALSAWVCLSADFAVGITMAWLERKIEQGEGDKSSKFVALACLLGIAAIFFSGVISAKFISQLL